jgi:hypothetical protein
LNVNRIDSFFTHGFMFPTPVQALCSFRSRDTVGAATVHVPQGASGLGANE